MQRGISEWVRTGRCLAFRIRICTWSDRSGRRACPCCGPGIPQSSHGRVERCELVRRVMLFPVDLSTEYIERQVILAAGTFDRLCISESC